MASHDKSNREHGALVVKEERVDDCASTSSSLHGTLCSRIKEERDKEHDAFETASTSSQGALFIKEERVEEQDAHEMTPKTLPGIVIKEDTVERWVCCVKDSNSLQLSTGEQERKRVRKRLCGSEKRRLRKLRREEANKALLNNEHKETDTEASEGRDRDSNTLMATDGASASSSLQSTLCTSVKENRDKEHYGIISASSLHDSLFIQDERGIEQDVNVTASNSLQSSTSGQGVDAVVRTDTQQKRKQLKRRLCGSAKRRLRKLRREEATKALLNNEHNEIDNVVSEGRDPNSDIATDDDFASASSSLQGTLCIIIKEERDKNRDDIVTISSSQDSFFIKDEREMEQDVNVTAPETLPSVLFKEETIERRDSFAKDSNSLQLSAGGEEVNAEFRTDTQQERKQLTKRLCGSVKQRLRRLRRKEATKALLNDEHNEIDNGVSEGCDTNTEMVNEPRQVDFEKVHPIKMAVVPQRFPAQEFDGNVWSEFTSLLFAKIEADTRLPCIDMKGVIAGAMHISCYQQSDVDWLREALAGEKIQGMTVKVLLAKEVLMPIKIAWKTRNIQILDIARPLQLLNRYHPTLRTNQWRLLDTLVEDNHVRRILLIDRVSANYIKSCGYRLHAGLCTDIFKFIHDPIVERLKP